VELSLPLHEHHLAPSSNGSLSCWASLLLLATSSAALNKTTGMGGPASYMGYPLPCAPGSVGRKPYGQGSPPHRPDGAGQFWRVKVVDGEDEVDDDEVEERDSSSSVRWVLRSGTPGCFVCSAGALWASGAFGSSRRALRRGSLGCCCCSRLAPDPGSLLAPTLGAGPNVSRASSWPQPLTPKTSGGPCIASTRPSRR
jgi:hypothetical protein